MRAETGDDTYQFVAVRLPYGEQADEADAMAAIEFMQADVVKRVNIKPSVDAMVSAVEANGAAISDFNKGNIKARMRMIAQLHDLFQSRPLPCCRQLHTEQSCASGL